MADLKTAADGAAGERRLWIRKVQQLIKRAAADECETCYRSLNTLLAYIEGRTKRSSVKPPTKKAK